MMYGFRSFGFGVVGMLFMMLLCIAAAVVLIVFIIRSTSKNNAPGYYHSRAMDILDEKFAAGEISEEEYSHKKMIINMK